MCKTTLINLMPISAVIAICYIYYCYYYLLIWTDKLQVYFHGENGKNIDSKPESTTLKSLTYCKTFSFYSNLHHYQHINTKKGMLSTSHWPQDKYVPVINITNGWLIVHKPLTFLIISTYEHHILK